MSLECRRNNTRLDQAEGKTGKELEADRQLVLLKRAQRMEEVGRDVESRGCFFNLTRMSWER